MAIRHLCDYLHISELCKYLLPRKFDLCLMKGCQPPLLLLPSPPPPAALLEKHVPFFMRQPNILILLFTDKTHNVKPQQRSVRKSQRARDNRAQALFVCVRVVLVSVIPRLVSASLKAFLAFSLFFAFHNRSRDCPNSYQIYIYWDNREKHRPKSTALYRDLIHLYTYILRIQADVYMNEVRNVFVMRNFIGYNALWLEFNKSR